MRLLRVAPRVEQARLDAVEAAPAGFVRQLEHVGPVGRGLVVEEVAGLLAVHLPGAHGLARDRRTITSFRDSVRPSNSSRLK